MGDRNARMRSTLSDTFWVLVLSIVVLFAFFIALGAFSPGEVVWLSVGVLALALLWAVHAAWDARHRTGRDAASIRNRERRGF
jgi:fatty acid desaturase